MTRKTAAVDLDNAVNLYVAGESAYKIASTTRVDRGALKRELLRRGIEPRGRSSAGLLRTSKMTPEQREAQVAAAHIAATGRRQSERERIKYAQARERNAANIPMSSGESQFAGWMHERRMPYRREVAVGPYNVDFALGALAVEILGGEWHGYKPVHADRTPYILDKGWNLAFLWDTTNAPMLPDVAEYVITWANETSRNPPASGEYRVLRGDAHLIASGSTNENQMTLIPPARYCEDRTLSEIARMGSDARWGKRQ